MIDQILEKLVEFSPTTAYYLDGGMNDELDIERRTRKDIVYNLSKELDIDVVCEDLVHKTDVADVTIENLLSTSIEELPRIEESIGKYINFIKEKFSKIEDTFTEFPKGVFNAQYNRMNLPDFINDETKFSRQLDEMSKPIDKFNMVEKHCINNIYILRKEWYGMIDDDIKKRQVEKEIKKMVLNIRNFRYATDIKNLNDIYLRLLSVDTMTISHTTILDNNLQGAQKTLDLVKTNIINKKMLHDVYRIISNPEITNNYLYKADKIRKTWYSDVQDDELQRTIKVEKAVKSLKSSVIPVLYSTYNGVRPNEDIGDFEYWNGIQAFDLDIKECSDKVRCEFRKKDIVSKYHYSVEECLVMKQQLHDRLKKYSWYMCTKTSVSGRGVHVLTKIKPFHHLYKGEKNNNMLNKFWFLMNYYHKYTIIRWVLLNDCKIPEKFINQVIDRSMAKISQGIVLNTDTKALWNNNFLDLPFFYGLNVPPKKGLEDNEWILEEGNLKRILTSKALSAVGHETLSKMRNKTHHTVDVAPVYDTITYEFSSVEMPQLKDVTPVDESKYQSGNRDFMRMKVIRTIIYIYGVSDDVKNLCRHLLKVPHIFSEKEFHGKWNYAHKKPFIFDDMLILLRACGCIFDIESDILQEVKDSKLHKAVESLKETDIVFNEVMPDYSFILDKNRPYLGEITHDLLDSFESDKVNVIEAAPGTGKTTLFNNLAKEYRVCLVCPYTSILQSKVENDPATAALFNVFYGEGEQGRIKFEDGKSIATTYDKFKYMTEDEYKLFDLIAVDESHLLFTSTFRGAVTTGVANHVKKFVSNEMAKKETMQFDIGMTSNGGILENTSLFRTMANSGTKIVMMTGTLTGELLYFRHHNILNYIKVGSTHKYGKHVDFVLTDTVKNARLILVQTIAKALKEGKTVICPSNSGDEYVHSIVAQVNHIIEGTLLEDEWTYYKKSNSHNPICKSINENSSLLDNTRLLFCTVYLGVGVDILTERDYLVVFDGDNTTAQDMEQFNNRIRKSKIKCAAIYSALSENVAGLNEIKKSIYDTPSEIELKRADDYQLDINDDRRIAKSNRAITKNDEYARLKLPDNLNLNELYHDITNDGVEFNEDKFVISGFSLDYNKIARGAAYSKYVLSTYYNYTVSYRLALMDSEELVSVLDEVGRNAKSRVVSDKGSAFLQSIDFIGDNWDKLRNWNIIDFEQLKIDTFEIELVSADKSREGKELKEWTIKYSKPFEEQFKNAHSKMRRLLKFYEIDTAKSFLKSHVSDSGRINKAELRREMRLITFMKQATDKELLLATSDVFEIVEDFLNDSDQNIVEVAPSEYLLDEFAMRSIKIQLSKYSDKYFKTMGGEETNLTSIKRREEMFEKTDETLKTVFKVRKNKEGDYKMKFRTIPPFDSKDLENTFLFDELLQHFLSGEIEVNEQVITPDELESDISNRDSKDYGTKVDSFGLFNL